MEQPDRRSYHEPTNWLGGICPNSVGAEANFLERIGGTATVSCQEPVVVGSMDFRSPHSYTIAGQGEITFQASSGDARIAVELGEHVITTTALLCRQPDDQHRRWRPTGPRPEAGYSFPGSHLDQGGDRDLDAR